MGRGQLLSGWSLLELLPPKDELLPVKNTFVHYPCDTETAEGFALALPRCSTDPTPGPQRALGRVAAVPLQGQEEEAEEEQQASEQARESAQKQAQLGEKAEEEDGPLDVQPAEEAVPKLRQSWPLAGRRLRGRDTRLSKIFYMPVAQGARAETEFVLTLYPKVANKRRGGSCFQAAKSKGFANVKCNAFADDIELFVSITVGSTGVAETRLHNFFKEPVCKFLGEWDFEDATDKDSDTSMIMFEVAFAGLPLTRCASISAAATLQEQMDEQEEDPGDEKERVDAYPCGAEVSAAEVLCVQERAAWAADGSGAWALGVIGDGCFILNGSDFWLADGSTSWCDDSAGTWETAPWGWSAAWDGS